MLNINNTLIPIISVIALFLGNIFRLAEIDVATLEESLLAIATSVAAIYGVYGVWKNKKTKREAELEKLSKKAKK